MELLPATLENGYESRLSEIDITLLLLEEEAEAWEDDIFNIWDRFDSGEDISDEEYQRLKDDLPGAFTKVGMAFTKDGQPYPVIL